MLLPLLLEGEEGGFPMLFFVLSMDVTRGRRDAKRRPSLCYRPNGRTTELAWEAPRVEVRVREIR